LERWQTRLAARFKPRLQYIRLESYEDALDNISFESADAQAMFQMEDYVLSYMLDFETKQSETLLNVAKLDAPSITG